MARGSWRWFGTFPALGPLLSAAQLLAFFALVVLVVILYVAGVGWLGWIVVAVSGGAALLWWATMEMAHVVAVGDDLRNVFGVSPRAASFVLRHALAVGELYGLTILTWAPLIMLYGWGLRPRISGGWLLLFLLQQVLVVIRLSVRLARLAGGIRLYQARSGARVHFSLGASCKLAARGHRSDHSR